MGSLYLLSEEKDQEDFRTKAKYLYKSYFNMRSSRYLDSEGLDYLYLSFTHGILSPEEEVDPYNTKKIRDSKMWGLLAFSMMQEYLEGKDEIILFYSGNSYQELEENLKEDGKSIIAPIKNFTRVNLKNRWIDYIITESILN